MASRGQRRRGPRARYRVRDWAAHDRALVHRGNITTWLRAAARLDPLTGRGRHALIVARDGRAAWEQAAGHRRRNAAEWTLSRLKRVLGPGLRSRSLDAQRAEAGTAAHALNRMADLGLPWAQRVT